MKNKQTSRSRAQEERTNTIPDLNIIDLGEESPGENSPHGEQEASPAPKGLSSVNLHVVFLITFVVLILVFIGGLIYKFMTWGRQVDLDELLKDRPEVEDNSMDLMMPLLNADNTPVYKSYGEGTNIVFFGNAPFADDRNSPDNLVNMIQKLTGIQAYNCSVSGSYLAALYPYLNEAEYPLDIFNFYWLCHLALGDLVDEKYLEGLKVLGDSAPPEAMEVYEALNSIDFNTVDVIAIMYDGSDYLAGHEMYSDENDTDILQFTGNLEAGIALWQDAYPHIRIIVLSPTYAYGIDENGSYISSDIQRYGQDVLSTYSIKEYQSCSSRNVTFVDNLYGTITEDNASEYLTDHLHLNVEGREKVALRFVEALNYFSKEAGAE